MLNKVLSLFCAVALIAVMVGCFGDLAPMTPSNDDVKSEQPQWLTYDVPDQARVGKVVTVSATVDPRKGGSVSWDNDGFEVALHVPPQGSWKKSVTISLLLDKPGKLLFTFGPDGTQFDPPATLMVKEAKVRGDAVSLYWWDPSVSQWINIGPVNVAPDGTITARISHFSRYGMAD